MVQVVLILLAVIWLVPTLGLFVASLRSQQDDNSSGWWHVFTAPSQLTFKAYSDLLGKAIRSMIEVKEEKDLDSLFTGGKTTALTNTISGLDDFELISFLVIQEAG